MSPQRNQDPVPEEWIRGPQLRREVIAAAELIGKTGAASLEVGYLHDDVPAHQASWYAIAWYEGVKIIADEHPGPGEALRALLRKLLEGGLCKKCGRSPVLEGFTHADGRPECEFRLRGDHYIRTCEIEAH